MIENIQYLSILIEFVVAILGLLIVFQKKMAFGWFLFITFGIYVFYDLAKFSGLVVSSSLLYVLFFLASVSALFLALAVYRRRLK